MKFYAVAKGRKPGIYLTWEECKKQVDKLDGAKFKSFPTYEEAEFYYILHNNGNLPKKRYTNGDLQRAKEKGTPYEHVVNCVLCGKPFKPLKGKNNTRRNAMNCISCKNKMREVNAEIKRRTNGQLGRVSKNQFLYIQKKYKCENVFSYILANMDVITDAKLNATGTELIKEQRMKDQKHVKISAKDGTPLYVKQLLGEDKILISISGDKRNPAITYRCTRCHNDYKVHYSSLKKHKGHDCSALDSSGEGIVKNYLNMLGVKYITQRDTLKCINPDTGHVMPYDFEIPEKKVIIEVQGEQHRKFIEWFHVDESGFAYQKQKDNHKKQFAEEQGYKVIELWYSDFENGKYKAIINNALRV